MAIPESLRKEHHELLHEFEQIRKMRGKVKEAAEKVASILEPHFEKEEKFALPILGLLRELAEDRESPDFPRAGALQERLTRDYQEMLSEHNEIVKALEQLRKAATGANKRRVAGFVEKLKLHARTEEEVLYPAAIVAGKIIKLRM